MSKSQRTAFAAVILIVPVALELAWHPVGDQAWGQVTFGMSQAAGWLLILSACRETTAPIGRAARFGRTSVLTGCWLQVTFGALYAGTALDGEPLEAAFIAFLLGFLALFVGGLTWGIHLVRTGSGRLAGAGLLATAVLGLMAIVFGGDPWHDIFLLSSYAAWVAVGRGLDALAKSPAPIVTARH